MAVSVGATNENNKRFALIIAASEYQDSDFQKLIAPGKDAEALASVLKNPDIGGYDDVKAVKNEPAYKVNEEIQAFFSDRRRNDLLLLYFSCHGVKDEDGHLYYAAINTRRKLLAATAISANFVNEIMARSRSRRQVLVADCCYSGAFGRGFITRADKKIHTGEYFEQGRGRIVLTASDSMQYSFEEDKLQLEVDEPGSIFTRAIVEGLNTGKADLNEDGLVSYDELYDYTFDRVIDETPNQRPQKWEFGVEGDVVIAKNPYKRKTEDPNELVQDALDNLKKGDYHAALEYSDKAIKLKPAVAFAYNIKGQALFSLRQYREALACYEKTLELRPNFIEAINNKGLVYSATGDYNKSVECFNQSTDLNPSDASIWNYKGLAFHALGKYEDAIASYDKAIILRHNYIEAVNNRESSVEIKKKQLEEQHQQQAGTTTTSDRIHDISSPSSPKVKKDDYTAVGQNAYKSGAPIGTNYQTAEPQSPAHASITKENVHSDIPNVKGASPVYRGSEDSRRFDTQEIKKQDSNLKMMIPVAVGVIGVVIAVFIFGSGMMHQQTQPPTAPAPSPVNPSSTAGRVISPTTHAVPNNSLPTATTTSTLSSSTAGRVISPTTHAVPNNTISSRVPIATDQSVTTNQNTPLSITLGGTDPNLNATLTAYIISPPLHGTLSSINQDTGAVTYTPNQGFTGNDSFTFKVNDGRVDSSNIGTVNIRINGAGSTLSSTTTNTTGTTISSAFPIATSQSVRTNQNTPVNIMLAGTDPNLNATLTAYIISPPLHGTLSSINQDTGAVTYTPNQGFTGNDSFTFKVNDGRVDSSNIGTVNIRVGGF